MICHNENSSKAARCDSEGSDVGVAADGNLVAQRAPQPGLRSLGQDGQLLPNCLAQESDQEVVARKTEIQAVLPKIQDLTNNFHVEIKTFLKYESLLEFE